MVLNIAFSKSVLVLINKNGCKPNPDFCWSWRKGGGTQIFADRVCYWLEEVTRIVKKGLAQKTFIRNSVFLHYYFQNNCLKYNYFVLRLFKYYLIAEARGGGRQIFILGYDEGGDVSQMLIFTDRGKGASKKGQNRLR